MLTIRSALMTTVAAAAVAWRLLFNIFCAVAVGDTDDVCAKAGIAAINDAMELE